MQWPLLIGAGLLAWSLAPQRASAAAGPAGVRAMPDVSDGAGLGVDWSRVRHFAPHEFRGRVSQTAPLRDLVPMVEPRLIYAVDELRERLGSPLVVSPAPGAIARDYAPESQHYVGGGRRSTAIDLFIEPGVSFAEVRRIARDIPAIGGLGAYPHTRPRRMIHVDVRGQGERLATWARDARGEYVAFGYGVEADRQRGVA